MPAKTQITRKRRYLEKDFQTDFNKWLKHIHYKTGAFELKIADGNSLSFSAVTPHQQDALYATKHGNLVYKIPDDGMAQRPFDCFMMVMVPAFVVVMFHAKQPDQKEFFMIDIDRWIEEATDSTRKSLTSERASEIGSQCFLA